MYAVCLNIESSCKRLFKHFFHFINECNVKSISINALEDEKDKSLYDLSQLAQKFEEFASDSKAINCNVKFSVICTCNYNNSVLLYSKNMGQFTAITIPDRPNKPAVKKVRSTSVTLSYAFDRSTCPWGIDDCYVIVSYSCIVQVKTANHTHGILCDWKVVVQEPIIINDAPEQYIKVNNLKPNTKNLFKLAIKYPYGISEYSDASEPVTTLLGRPGKPELQKINVKGKSVIKVAWMKPRSFGNLVNNYTVQYKNEDSDGVDWTCVTVNKGTSATIDDLSQGSTYTCKVVANSHHGHGEFEPSEAIHFVFDSSTRIGKPPCYILYCLITYF